jgi:hypothetical protein
MPLFVLALVEEEMTARLRVLTVEDDPDNAQFVRLSLLKARLTSFAVTRAETLAEADACLDSDEYDVVLLDLELPDARGFEGLRHLQDRYPEIPVVVLTSNGDPAVAMEAASQGAQDYLTKGDVKADVLEHVLHHAVSRHRMFLQLQSANKALDQKNARLEQLHETARHFVDTVSHEFRTPLTVIKEYVTIIRDGLAGPVTERQREFLGIANDRADDLAIMVDDMLDASRLEAGVLSVWRRESKVADILDHVRPLLERKAAVRHVSLEISSHEDLPNVYCDPEKIGRVVVNLAANAIKTCGQGGNVKLWAKRNHDAGEVLIGVTDTGPGISRDNLKVIFQRFRQSNDSVAGGTEGFGLGLAIAKGLVQLNFGEMRVESALGEGSTFSFTVPVWDPLEVLRRYVARVEADANDAKSAGLIVARTPPSTAPAASHVIDEFLQDHFRGNDLVVRANPHQWLIVVNRHDGEMDRVLERVTEAWSNANRNMPGEGLPQIAYREVGTWTSAAGSGALAREFAAALAAPLDEPPSPTVLLVDDDRELVQGLEIRLRAGGFEVLTAFDGTSGIRQAVEHGPDAILMDNHMPEMSGLEAIRRLAGRPETAKIPVIILSASLRDQQQALEHGARFFLQKPCDAKTITLALRDAMTAAATPGGVRS